MTILLLRRHDHESGSSIEGYGRSPGGFRRGGVSGLIVSSLLAVAGCAGDSGPEDRSTWKGVDKAEQSVRTAESDNRRTSTGPTASPNQRPAALLANESITWADLSVPLAEAAGGAVLEEVALDRLLAKEMQLRGLSLEPGAGTQEEEYLREALAVAAGVQAGQQGDLVQQLRRSRGLGDRRYASLLDRNAKLRRMVRDEVKVTPEDVQQAFEIRYGQRFQTRLILTRTEREAGDAADRLRAGEPFAEVATKLSTDPSRLRGGAIGTISPADPSYPMALRKSIASSTVGAPTSVIALEQGYAIVLVEQVIPPTAASFDAAAPGLEREVRLVRERAAMDRLAAQLLRAANITVLDPSLDWSWKAREGQ
jgi:hypothetical protein